MTATDPSSSLPSSYQHSTTTYPHDTVITVQDDEQEDPRQPLRRLMGLPTKAIVALVLGLWMVAATTRLVFFSSGDMGRMSNTAAGLLSIPQPRVGCRRPPSSVIVDSNGIIENGPGSDGSCNDTVHWYRDQLVDHFLLDVDDKASSKNKWSQKYFINDDYFAGPGHPIFYIMGGEDQADCLFYPFVTHNLARIFGGLTLEAEHRFYGDSQPLWENVENNVHDMVGLLTVEQTMHDFLRLRTYHKPNCAMFLLVRMYSPATLIYNLVHFIVVVIIGSQGQTRRIWLLARSRVVRLLSRDYGRGQLSRIFIRHAAFGTRRRD